MSGGQLEKAKLISDESDDIEFMYNPTQLTFDFSNQFDQQEGTRTEKGMPKVSFAYPNPSKITISKIVFDTWEQGENVLKYVDKFKQALNFATKGEAKGLRPPIYTFVWGKNQYLRCFIDSLSYTLTRFLPDGTPVQAEISQLVLQEADDPSGSSGSTDYSVNRDSGR